MQDQYTAVFGGFNFMELRKQYTVVNALRIRPEIICEVEYTLMLGFVGRT